MSDKTETTSTHGIDSTLYTFAEPDKFTATPHLISFPEPSDWKCYLFGGSHTSSIVWTPTKGEVPCWFWRKMQWLFFGNKWVKK
jgi:hypothetical protein